MDNYERVIEIQKSREYIRTYLMYDKHYKYSNAFKGKALEELVVNFITDHEIFVNSKNWKIVNEHMKIWVHLYIVTGNQKLGNELRKHGKLD